MTVYYVVDDQWVPLKTLYSRIPLYASYVKFQKGDKNDKGYKNYYAYLQQIRPLLVNDKCVHFTISDGEYYGFQKLIYYYIHGKNTGLSSEGNWVHRTETKKVQKNIEWVKLERDRLMIANRNIAR